jgi:hypothetical protein
MELVDPVPLPITIIMHASAALRIHLQGIKSPPAATRVEKLLTVSTNHSPSNLLGITRIFSSMSDEKNMEKKGDLQFEIESGERPTHDEICKSAL